MPQCPECSKEFKREQDVLMHRSKVHKKKRKYIKHKVNGVTKEKQSFSKLDLIQILQVKINALEEVKEMLRSL